MSSGLEGVTPEPRHAIVSPSLNIVSLPQEFLDQVAELVRRSMNRGVTEATHFNKLHSLRNFIKILMQKLPGQREVLEKIAQNINSQNFANLQQLKEYILDVKAQLIGVLKTVDEERAKGLHDVQPPHFLEDIFTLAALERQIDAAHLISDEDERANARWNISHALKEAGNIDKALEVAEWISDEYLKGEVLWDISLALAKAGNIDKALEVAWSISEYEIRGTTLWTISKALVDAGNIDTSLAVATSIHDKEAREGALRDISQALTRAGNIDTSLAVATSISHEETRGWALLDISQALRRAGNIERALAVARSISHEERRRVALRYIFAMIGNNA